MIIKRLYFILLLALTASPQSVDAFPKINSTESTKLILEAMLIGTYTYCMVYPIISFIFSQFAWNARFLYLAAKNENVAKVLEVLEYFKNNRNKKQLLNLLRKEYSSTFLHLTAKNEQIVDVLQCLQSCVDKKKLPQEIYAEILSAQDLYGLTFLHIAAKSKKIVDILQCLTGTLSPEELQKVLFAQNRWKQTFLHATINNEKTIPILEHLANNLTETTLFELLFVHDQYSPYGHTFLHTAAQMLNSKNIAKILSLIASKLSQENFEKLLAAKDMSRRTFLYYAIERDKKFFNIQCLQKSSFFKKWHENYTEKHYLAKTSF